MTERKKNQAETEAANPHDDRPLNDGEMQKVVGGMTIDEVDFSDGLTDEEQQVVESWAKTARRGPDN